METILEIIQRISFLAAMPAVAGIGVALGLLLILRRWQMHALGMALLYFFVALLHTRVIRPEVAVVKLLIGWMITMALYLTGRYLSERERERTEEEEGPLVPRDAPFRGLLLVAVYTLAVGGSVRYPLPQVPGDVNLACYLLGVGGLVLMGLSEEPFRAGLGILTFLAGFDLLFGALEPSLVVAGLLGATNFLSALAVTYLAVTHVSKHEVEI
ncbi:MAG TPA: hypothetical protein G4O00_13975 [Thermoflexia bacterium]|nr:hypothetical protein [Thermoflexia bacterium]